MHMRRGFLAVLVVLVGCHGGTGGVDGGPGPVGPHPLYAHDPQAQGNPFPDDRLVAGGALNTRPRFWADFVPPGALSKTLTHFEEKNAASFASVSGHGNSGPTLIAFSEAVNPDTLSGRVNFLLRTPTGWKVGPDAHVTYTDAGGGVFFMSARPLVALPNGQPAALVLTRGIISATGTVLSPAPEFLAEPHPELAAQARALQRSVEDVLLVLDLQPQDATRDLLQLADWAAQDVPVSYAIHTADGGNDPLQPLGVWSGAGVGTWTPYLQNYDAQRLSHGTFGDVGALVMGTFQSRDLRQVQVDPTSGLIAASPWKREWVESPDLAPSADLRFLLVLPKQKQANGKYRVVLAGHGLNGRNTFNVTKNPVDPTSFCGGLAEYLAAQGIGCLGIDAVRHGSRGNASGDVDLVGFFNLDDLQSSRDNFRQTEFDLLQLSRLATQLDIDGDGVPDLDAESVGYFGNSLGGIMGTVFLATDKRVKYGVLNVPTGGLAMMFDAPYIHGLLGLLVSVKTGIDYNTQPQFDQSLKLFEAQGQMVLEGCDPFNFAPLLAAKHVLAQEGVGDRTLPNANTEELFLGAGLPLITADVQSAGGVSGFERFKPIDYGATNPDFDPHGTFYAVPQLRAQALDFLVSRGTHLSYEHP
jgi:hypothetical protein